MIGKLYRWPEVDELLEVTSPQDWRLRRDGDRLFGVTTWRTVDGTTLYCWADEEDPICFCRVSAELPPGEWE